MSNEIPSKKTNQEEPLIIEGGVAAESVDSEQVGSAEDLVQLQEANKILDQKRAAGVREEIAGYKGGKSIDHSVTKASAPVDSAKVPTSFWGKLKSGVSGVASRIKNVFAGATTTTESSVVSDKTKAVDPLMRKEVKALKRFVDKHDRRDREIKILVKALEDSDYQKIVDLLSYSQDVFGEMVKGASPAFLQKLTKEIPGLDVKNPDLVAVSKIFYQKAKAGLKRNQDQEIIRGEKELQQFSNAVKIKNYRLALDLLPYMQSAMDQRIKDNDPKMNKILDFLGIKDRDSVAAGKQIRLWLEQNINNQVESSQKKAA